MRSPRPRTGAGRGRWSSSATASTWRGATTGSTGSTPRRPAPLGLGDAGRQRQQLGHPVVVDDQPDRDADQRRLGAAGSAGRAELHRRDPVERQLLRQPHPGRRRRPSSAATRRSARRGAPARRAATIPSDDFSARFTPGRDAGGRGADQGDRQLRRRHPRLGRRRAGHQQLERRRLQRPDRHLADPRRRRPQGRASSTTSTAGRRRQPWVSRSSRSHRRRRRTPPRRTRRSRRRRTRPRCPPAR